MTKSISRHYAIRVVAPDPEAALKMGNPCPKYSDRVEYYKETENAKQRAEREHLINLRERFPKHLQQRYPNYKKEIGAILRAEANTKHKGGFEPPYTLD